jgi:hypothetical protein
LRHVPLARSAPLAAVLLFAGLGPAGATPRAAESPPERRTAAILFLSTCMLPPPPCDLAQVHEGAWDRLTSAARCLGAEVVSRSAIEPLVRDWRVRTSLGISTGFLDSLSAEFACGRILVVDVTICPDRLLVTGRVTTIVDRETIWAGAAEEKLPRNLANGEEAATTPWVGVMEQACRRLLEQWTEVPAMAATSKLYLLPVRQTGLDDLVADLVSHCLLCSLIGRQWRIQDPGVTFSRLRDAGVDPRQLSPRARLELIGGAPGVLVVGDVATYEEVDATDAPSGEEELSPLSRSVLPSFSVSARWMDGSSGEVTSAATLYVGAGQTRGLFGTARNSSPVRQVQRATDRLVRVANKKG